MSDLGINPGTRGHTRSTWRDETHLRGVLLRLIAENQDANREEIEALYLAKCEVVPRLVEEALRRSFDNDWKQFQKPATVRRPRTAEEIESARAAIEAAVEKIKTVVLLDQIQPNGKMLRDCTGEEVRKMEKERPIWVQKLLAKVKPTEIVGKVLSEDQVRAMAPKGWK